jgi:hypothetical protein
MTFIMKNGLVCPPSFCVAVLAAAGDNCVDRRLVGRSCVSLSYIYRLVDDGGDDDKEEAEKECKCMRLKYKLHFASTLILPNILPLKMLTWMAAFEFYIYLFKIILSKNKTWVNNISRASPGTKRQQRQQHHQISPPLARISVFIYLFSLSLNYFFVVPTFLFFLVWEFLRINYYLRIPS